MQADGIADPPRRTVPIVRPGIEVADGAETVAAQRQRVVVLAHAVFAGVERIAAEIAASRIAVGHHHLGHRGAVHDGAQPALVLVGDVIEDESLAHVEADADVPLLPAHEVALDREARPLRLHDAEWFHVAAQTLLAGDHGLFRRDRHRAEIIDPDHRAAPQVDHRVQVGDGPAIGVAAVGIHQPAVAIGDALARLAREAEMSGGPGLHQHLVHVGDAARGAGGDEAGIGACDAPAFQELVAHDARLYARHMAPGFERAAAQVHHAVEGPVARPLVAAHEGAPREGPSGREGANLRLVGFRQGNGLEPGRVVKSAGPPYGSGGRRDLVAVERIAWVKRKAHSGSRISGVVEQ